MIPLSTVSADLSRMHSTHRDLIGCLRDAIAASVQGAVHAQPQIRWAETWQRSVREQPAVDLLPLGKISGGGSPRSYQGHIWPGEAFRGHASLRMMLGDLAVNHHLQGGPARV